MRGPSALTPPKKLDLTFLTVGTTSRQEVLERLAWVDAEVGGDRFFFGRWKQNSWDVEWIAAAYYTAGSGGSEQWRVRNVIIDFDERSVIRQITYFPNRRMTTMLSARLIPDKNHTLDLHTPVSVAVAYLHDHQRRTEYGSLILSQDTFEFAVRGPGDQGKYNFETTPDNLAAITMDWSTQPGTLSEVIQTIRFKRRTNAGRTMTISVDLVGAATLIKYFAQTHPVSSTRSQ